jgi:hypothetical protein
MHKPKQTSFITTDSCELSRLGTDGSRACAVVSVTGVEALPLALADGSQTQTPSAQDAIVVRIDPMLASLIPGFLHNRREDVIAMRAALADGDFSTIGRLGHGMRGSGRGYGFQAKTDIGKGLELAAEISDHAASQILLRELTSYLDRVEVI